VQPDAVAYDLDSSRVLDPDTDRSTAVGVLVDPPVQPSGFVCTEEVAEIGEVVDSLVHNVGSCWVGVPSSPATCKVSLLILAACRICVRSVMARDRVSGEELC